MRVAIYCRVAFDIDALKKQFELVRGQVIKNGYNVVMEEYDIGSGLYYERAGLQKIMNAVKENKVDAVAIEDMSIIGRDIIKNLNFVKFLRDNNVELIILDGNNDELMNFLTNSINK